MKFIFFAKKNDFFGKIILFMSNSVSLYGVSSFFYEITEGFASASPDYETTSQQDNEWGFAEPTLTCSL